MGKVRLVPLELMPPTSASAGQYINCIQTGVQKSWNAAAKAGWVADLDGKAYLDYYSPEGLAQKQALDAKSAY
ncbi:MAG: hypothetical protein M0R32_05820 [Candidatus Cloacimonetes bacterium]|jgi:hypothetical protein|nr:hypothetical protein [Candidatus Cloacimonadota bacterium]